VPDMTTPRPIILHAAYTPAVLLFPVRSTYRRKVFEVVRSSTKSPSAVAAKCWHAIL
jgi:hypothetical protein